MKKQLLSIILSCSMVLNNCLDGFVVIAESNVGKNNTESTNIIDEDENDNDDENNLPEEEEEQNVIELKVVPEENFPFSMYYGQDIPDFNYVEEDKKTPAYYSVVSNSEDESEVIIPETVYENISVLITDYSGRLPVRDYNLNVVCENETITDGKTTYKIITDSLEKPFQVLEYDISEIKVEPYLINGEQYIRSSDNNFEISLDETFSEVSESGILLSALKNNKNQYYIRNIDKEKPETYNAIAGPVTYNSKSECSILDYAEITSENPDISSGRYNNYITFNVSGTISGYSEEDVMSVLQDKLIVKNNGQKLNKCNLTCKIQKKNKSG